MTKALARPGWAELSRRDCVAPVSPSSGSDGREESCRPLAQERGGVPRLRAAGGQPPGRAQPLRGSKRSGQHWGRATEAAWVGKDTDKSWGTEKQHKAINNRSEFRSVRVLGDPTSPGAGAHPAPAAQADTAPGHSLPHTPGRAVYCPVSTRQAEDATAPPDCTHCPACGHT